MGIFYDELGELKQWARYARIILIIVILTCLFVVLPLYLLQSTTPTSTNSPIQNAFTISLK